jgi:hypothetical protein
MVMVMGIGRPENIKEAFRGYDKSLGTLNK